MTTSILNQLAFKGMHAHRKRYTPFILAVSIMFGLLYVMISLSTNSYVHSRHADLPTILNMGIVVTGFLSVIITVYTSRFVQEGQMQEFGMYSILGLEKRHIQWINFLQSLVSAAISFLMANVLGYFLGNFMFILLNRLLEDTGASFMDYPFEWNTTFYIFILMAISFGIIMAMNARGIHRHNPISLFESSKKNQGEPKGRWFLTILGLASLGYGYYIALTVDQVLGALNNIGLAALLVIIGTYLLFISLTILVLKWMRSRKDYYYKTNRFLSISGMLSRMSSNAVSLASIAIMSSGAILVLGATTTLYAHMEATAGDKIPTDYRVSLQDSGGFLTEERITQLQEDIEQIDGVSNMRRHQYYFTAAYLVDDSIYPFYAPDTPEFKEVEDPNGKVIFVLADSLESYNGYLGEDEQLNSGELLIASNLLDVENMDNLKIEDRDYLLSPVNSRIIPSEMGAEVLAIVFPNQEELDQFINNYQMSPTPGESMPVPMNVEFYFDYEGSSDVIEEKLQELNQELSNESQGIQNFNYQSKESIRHFEYQTNGGLLFIGVLVSIVLIVGTVVTLYFKQISEAQTDRDNYQIMKKVGLTDQVIKKTIRTQVLWLFFLPLIVASIHNVVASRIMFRLFGLLGLTSYPFLAKYYGLAILIFAVIYLVFYFITSRSYYQIVNVKES